MKELTDRRCRKNDRPFVYKITKLTLVPFISKYVKPSKKIFDSGFDRDYKSIKILLMGKRRIGFYQLEPRGKTLDIVKIFLSPTYQGKGIGRKLFQKFENQGYNKISLQVWDNNPALKFYKKLGYREVKRIKHKIHMEKKLK